MAAERYFEFDNVAECKAFIKGVQYVNDSTVQVHGAFSVPGAGNRRVIDTRGFVWLTDQDANKSESDKKPPRWKLKRRAYCPECGLEDGQHKMSCDTPFKD